MPRRPKSQIKVLRENKGLTQRALADSWGVSEVTVQNWETEASKAYALTCFVLLCEALACQPEDLIDTRPVSSSNHNIHYIRKQIRSTNKSNIDTDFPSLRLAKLRTINGFTQENLAAVIDVSVNTIQNWENRRTSGKKIVKIIRLCEILECKYTELVTNIPEYKIDNIQSLRAKKLVLHRQKNRDINTIKKKLKKRKSNEGCSGAKNFLPNNSSN